MNLSKTNILIRVISSATKTTGNRTSSRYCVGAQSGSRGVLGFQRPATCCAAGDETPTAAARAAAARDGARAGAARVDSGGNPPPLVRCPPDAAAAAAAFTAAAGATTAARRLRVPAPFQRAAAASRTLCPSPRA